MKKDEAQKALERLGGDKTIKQGIKREIKKRYAYLGKRFQSRNRPNADMREVQQEIKELQAKYRSLL